MGVVPVVDLPPVVAPCGFGDDGADAGVVGFEAPLVLESEVAHEGGRCFDGTAVAEDEYFGVSVVFFGDVAGEVGDAGHVFAVRLAARESHVGSDRRIEDLCECVGVFVAELLPRVALAVAVVLFPYCGTRLDRVIRSELQQRFGSLKRADRITRVDGVEMAVFEPFAEQIRLRPARFVKRHIGVALC